MCCWIGSQRSMWYGHMLLAKVWFRHHCSAHIAVTGWCWFIFLVFTVKPLTSVPYQKKYQFTILEYWLSSFSAIKIKSFTYIISHGKPQLLAQTSTWLGIGPSCSPTFTLKYSLLLLLVWYGAMSLLCDSWAYYSISLWHSNVWTG